MEQTRSVRNKSYGVIRDLLDNADNQGGMQASITYVDGALRCFSLVKDFQNTTRYGLASRIQRHSNSQI